MKRLLGLMIAFLTGLAGIHAMSYEEARDRARFLTDKMAYALNLNDQQYNDAYEINLDYLMNIRTASDASGVYLEYRNADLRCILYDWQYALFQAATYFFRPILWRATGWFLPVYTIYSPTLFYYSPPRVYHIYRGGHFRYRHERRVSFYANRRPAWHGGLRGESRRPVPGRPVPPHGHGGNGFHFEPVGRPGQNPAKPANRPANHKGNGFRFEPVGNPPRNDNRPGDNAKPSQTVTQPNRPATSHATRPARPGKTTARPMKTPNVATQDRPHSAPPASDNSHYRRKSSTRATVGNSSQQSHIQPRRPSVRPRNNAARRQHGTTARKPTSPARTHRTTR